MLKLFSPHFETPLSEFELCYFDLDLMFQDVEDPKIFLQGRMLASFLTNPEFLVTLPMFADLLFEAQI